MLSVQKVGAPVCKATGRFSGQAGRKLSGRSSSGGKVAATLVAGTIAVVGSTLAYSYVDPTFRSTVESQAPFTKPLYKAILGDSISNHVGTLPLLSPTTHKPIVKEFVSVKPELKVQEKEKENIDSRTSLPMEEKKEKSLPVAESSSTKSQPMASKKSNKPVNPFAGVDNSEKKNHDLEDSLKAAINIAETNVRGATSAKLATIRAIEYHIQTIREAVEAGPSGNWQAVVAAHAAAEAAAKADIAAELTGRMSVDGLKKVINLGGQGETTQLNPLLLMSRETASKLLRELDDMTKMIKQVDSERIFVREYGHLVEEGRKKFAAELKAVLPSADLGSSVKKLTEKQTNALLAHAHLRVDQLRREIIQQKLTEENRIRKAVADEKANVVRAVAAQELTAEASQDEIVRIKNNFNAELEKRLALAKNKYDKQLKEVVVTQKQLYDIEHAKDVEQAVQAERSVHTGSISRALARLEGIETALKGRVAQDVENRRSKQMWLATQNLVDNIEFGKKSSCCMEGRRLPLSPQLMVLSDNAKEDLFMNTVISSVDKVTKVRGEYTSEDIKSRLNKAIRIGYRVATLDANGGGVLLHMVSYFRDLISFRFSHKYNDSDKFDPKCESNTSLLNRASYYLSKGRIIDALKFLQQTTGPTKQVLADIINDARRHEEAMLLARLMLAHSAVSSIRSTY